MARRRAARQGGEMSQTVVANLIARLKKAAPPPPETAPAETGETHEQTPVCLTPPAGVFIGETPPKMGGETGETRETAQNSNLLCASAEATPTPAPDLTPAIGGSEVAPSLPSVVTTPARTAPPAPAKAPAWFHLESSWRVASMAWQAHRNTCPTCQTSERTAATAGTGIRCDEGQRLHATYEAALD